MLGQAAVADKRREADERAIFDAVPGVCGTGAARFIGIYEVVHRAILSQLFARAEADSRSCRGGVLALGRYVLLR